VELPFEKFLDSGLSFQQPRPLQSGLIPPTFPMMKPSSAVLLLLGACLLPAVAQAPEGKPQPVKPKGATASSANPKYPAAKAIDGKVSDDSRWVSEPFTAPATLEIDLGTKQKLGGVHVFTGNGNKDVVEAFSMQFWQDGKWVDIPSATVTSNKKPAVSVSFDQTVDVITDKLRIQIDKSHQNVARVKEIVIWPWTSGDLPPIGGGGGHDDALADQEKIPLIYLNQSGFNLGKPKKFTAPTLADGTKFVVRPAKGGAALFEGTIKGNIGDFSAFNPTDQQEFVVEAGGITSVPFRIGNWWIERVSYQNMVNFMIDSRHYVGNTNAKCTGSYGWRDDHHFGWELTTLVPQYLSNPSAYERMPHQIKYVAPKDKQVWGALQPYKEDAPDIVKLIHWGADVIVSPGVNNEMMKAQLAYFLYAWPVLKKYLPQQNYDVVRDFAFSKWADPTKDRKYPYDESSENNLLAVKTHIGSTKGAYPPGFSIEPNLLMYEVTKREKRPDADIYLNAAKAQAEWMIKNLDWNNPQVTKGQRMSEFITMTGLANFQRMYPDKAPAGLAAKINEWVKVMFRRSANMWDFRKHDDKDSWTPMDPSHPQKWNEPGNVVGLPASLLAAREVVTDPATKARLEEIAYAHIDNLFGRNPLGRHFGFKAPKEVEGVEFGWTKRHPGGIGRLADARFVIDGSPKTFHYPYHPELAAKGYTEGWIQFNTPFNLSMSYLAFAETKIALSREKDELVIRMEAPLNFDYSKVETGAVTVTSANGDQETVTVTEESPNSRVFVGKIKVAPTAASTPGDKTLQVAPGGSAEVSHGFGFLGRKATQKF